MPGLRVRYFFAGTAFVWCAGKEMGLIALTSTVSFAEIRSDVIGRRDAAALCGIVCFSMLVLRTLAQPFDAQHITQMLVHMGCHDIKYRFFIESAAPRGRIDAQTKQFTSITRRSSFYCCEPSA